MSPFTLAPPRKPLHQQMCDMMAEQLKARAGTSTAGNGPSLDTLESSWQSWLSTLFSSYLRNTKGAQVAWAPHHEDFWAWAWSLRPGVRPTPFIGVWARGGAKSTSAELATVQIGARRLRRYGIYLSGTQTQADDHVSNVASMLESTLFGHYYPDVASRLVGKYGSSRGWRRNRLRTRSGFTLDAYGLDAALRGAKLDETRPDFIVLDDVDGKNDSSAAVEKKIGIITTSILPAGTSDLAVLGIQNLIHAESIFSRLVDRRADFLTDRHVSGPFPALLDFLYEEQDYQYVITHGTPTWVGQDVAACQDLIKTIGLTSFLQECQHDVQVKPGGLFSHLTYKHCEWKDVPDLVDIQVWVDPAVTDTDASDSHGIQADGIAADETIYRLWSWEQRTSPEDSLRRAILKACELGASVVGVETDQGGDTWQSTYRESLRKLKDEGQLPYEPLFKSAKAGAGHGSKTHRWGLMVADYERGGMVHVVGTHELLERALYRVPMTKPLDLVDASYWSWWHLREPSRPRIRRL